MPATTERDKPHIVVLDGHALNPGDLSWEPLHALGRVVIYPRSSPEEVVQRAREAELVLANKAPLFREQLERLPKLKYIGITATGYNNVDLHAAAERGIVVSNVLGYGTHSVAQHAFALLLELTNRVAAHHASVKRGDWAAQSDFSYTLQPVVELAGKNLGVVGYGNIGRQVARIGRAFGMSVLVHSSHATAEAGVELVELKELFERSGVVSLNTALSPEKKGMVNAHLLQRMPQGAMLINTARGGLIDEQALVEALRAGPLAGAGLDVLAEEPPPPDHPLLELDNCLITPHMAWNSREARQRLLDRSLDHLRAFLHGAPQQQLRPPD
jgi:glycerate dehydrogenase